MHLVDTLTYYTFRLYIYILYIYVCFLGIESTTFALLAQCSTTEPQEQIKTINLLYIAAATQI